MFRIQNDGISGQLGVWFAPLGHQWSAMCLEMVSESQWLAVSFVIQASCIQKPDLDLDTLASLLPSSPIFRNIIFNEIQLTDYLLFLLLIFNMRCDACHLNFHISDFNFYGAVWLQGSVGEKQCRMTACIFYSLCCSG